ncbi:MAG: prepilin-type N-terminal cleavage/methylation domain-containing protein [Deltaproteobacteria bacterium]|uniref:prepilin-type N-terminal cleavage/methylation domain-containing protein n=1 Tax=Desulfobacula sp. TaxID=2593537 RepID=UPI0019A2476C|nr:prepilin-type N-terminal cleavage/methylation domain-containing protein [Candidatus Desulfobacula maris]MBL6993034.1 prepilin-type N-terminal cleavage/methylation domain-containing protein [Desulfobacula sp.]
MELKKKDFTSKEHGFTLVEILIAIAITGIVSAALFTAFQSQQKSYVAQEDVAVIQQNLRAGMDMMVREIRMAGYDPSRDANAGIVSAISDSIAFTIDETGDGDIDDSNEYITYSLYTSDNIQKLGRKSTVTANNQPVSENIDALEFFYKLADESQTLTPPDPTLIRSLRITMLARGDSADQKFVNANTYTTPGGQNWGPYNDNFRRRLLTTTVKCRNLGL